MNNPMTTNDKREQARVLKEWAQCIDVPDKCRHELHDIAAALLREAEAATAPDVSEAERPKRLCDYDPVETTVGDMVMRFGFDYTNFKFFAESITKLTAALRAARKREGELTQALADAKADWDHMTEIASQRLAHETRMRIERDTLRAENATLRAELAEAKADLEKLFAYDGTYCAAVLSGEVDDED